MRNTQNHFAQPWRSSCRNCVGWGGLGWIFVHCALLFETSYHVRLLSYGLAPSQPLGLCRAAYHKGSLATGSGCLWPYWVVHPIMKSPTSHHWGFRVAWCCFFANYPVTSVGISLVIRYRFSAVTRFRLVGSPPKKFSARVQVAWTLRKISTWVLLFGQSGMGEGEHIYLYGGAKFEVGLLMKTVSLCRI